VVAGPSGKAVEWFMASLLAAAADIGAIKKFAIKSHG
jgi:hypothetical protein